MKKIPITIISGFLGSGKTTLLNWILHSPHGLRIAVLVNDFGEINIDSQLITNVEGDTLSLANGCVCCTIRDDLAKAVLEICNRAEPPDYIVTETSGVSEPTAAAMGLVLSPDIAAKTQIDSIITVVDAEQILNLNDSNKHLAIDQIEAADLIVLNKIDLVSNTEINKVKQWLNSISSQTRIIEATQAEVPVELLINVETHDINNTNLHSHSHEDHATVFSTWSWFEDKPLCFEAIYEAFKTLPISVYRGKGILYLNEVPNKRVVLQMVGKRVTLSKGEPWHNTPKNSQIVLIADNQTLDTRSLKERFQSCITNESKTQQKAGQNRLATAVVEILRN